jgi:hypothetical protein
MHHNWVCKDINEMWEIGFQHGSSPRKGQTEEAHTPIPLKEDTLRPSPKVMNETNIVSKEPISSNPSISISQFESKMIFGYLGNFPSVSEKVCKEDFLSMLFRLKGPQPTTRIPLYDFHQPKEASPPATLITTSNTP